MESDDTARSMLERFLRIAPCRETDSKDIYRIGDLARDFDISLRTLRFYEDRGLLIPDRTGQTRLYSRSDRRRLKLILLAKGIGFSLGDIQKLLDFYDGKPNNGSAGDIILKKFRRQLETLQSQKAEVEKSIANLTNAIELITE